MTRTPLRAAAAAMVLILCSLVAIAEESAPAAETQKYTLRYRFAPDEVLRYEIGNDRTIDIQASGVKETVQHGETSVKRFLVKGIDASGVADLEVMIERVRLSAQGQGANITWDSDDQAPPPAEFRGLKGTIGHPLGTVSISPLGKIVDAQQQGAGSAAAQVKEGQLDMLPLLPEAPVAIGESWKQEFSLDVVIETPPYKRPVTIQRKFTLLSVEDGVATVDERTFVLTGPLDPKEEVQLLQRTPSGTFTLNIDEGRLIERKLKIDNRVVGFQGAQTEMKVVGTRVDRYLPESQSAAAGTDTTIK